MKTPLVFHNLLHNRARTLVALAGVAFAIILVFMQLGFFASAETTATVLFDKLDFDIAVVSANYLDINRPRSFPLARLIQLRGHEAVEQVAPLYISSHNWAIVEPESQPISGPRSVHRRGILVVGFNPENEVFRNELVFRADPPQVCLARLTLPDTVLMDTMTRDYFGQRAPGVSTELGAVRVTVVGQFTIGTGYGADGMVLTSEETFRHIFGPESTSQVSVGLVKLRPEARGNVAGVKQALLDAFTLGGVQDEVRLLTRDEVEQRERRFWVQKTSVGIIFTMGVIVACIVGTVFVYQVIASDIASNFREYATLRALGYTDHYLSGMILRQSLVLSILGYTPGLVLALVLYAVARSAANLPIFMTWSRALGVYLLALVMCSLSGYLALAKVRSADPADLF